MQVEHNKKSKLAKNSRLNLILTIVFLLGASLIVRLFYLQVWQANYYGSKADRQQLSSVSLKARRGEIYASERNPLSGETEPVLLATNKDYATLYAVPKDIAPETVTSTAELLYQYFDSGDKLGSSTKESIIANYINRLSKPNDVYEIIKKKIPSENILNFYAAVLSTSSAPLKADDLEVRGNQVFKKDCSLLSRATLTIKGLGFEEVPYRYYPENGSGAQLLGFVNYENQGSYGLEEAYNTELAGSAGYIKGQAGSPEIALAGSDDYVEAQDGSSLFLTIDESIQYQACKDLAEATNDYHFSEGTIIIIEPQTGAILAMCSYPDFDPNNYAKAKDAHVYINSATSEQYEPGSVFKTVTMAAAIDQKKLTPDSTYVDKGRIMIDGWPKPISNSDADTFGAHGLTTMRVVLDKSLNTGAIFAMESIGPKIFSDYVKNFGFGVKTGIELNAETKGDIHNLVKDYVRPIDAATAAFGQGLSVTPLQMLMSYATIANKGILMKPYLVKSIVKPDGTKVEVKPKEIRRVVSESSAAIISGMLGDVVENGHSKRAKVPGYYIGGKTGTAQIPAPGGGYLSDTYIHTFIGIAPIDKPRFVMLIKLDRPQLKFAESSAVPLFGKIASWLLNYYQVPKER